MHSAPKIFVIDACRGVKTEKMYTKPKAKAKPFEKSAKYSKTSDHSDSDNDGEHEILSRTDSVDFALIYASTHGNVAFSSRSKGSYLTQVLVSVIIEAPHDMPFGDILIEVKSRIQKMKVQQTVEIQDRLTRKYFIKR